ncbi:ENHANCER OF AG-4 protein 2 [Platanthera guangdongensis]|uniref:ENHANCER OF AG-4 protein 2 n=1 Tax=Platanthera guangdongensis TaxID=2320717 RepID=A0ABR2M8C5_9ASPA
MWNHRQKEWYQEGKKLRNTDPIVKWLSVIGKEDDQLLKLAKRKILQNGKWDDLLQASKNSFKSNEMIGLQNGRSKLKPITNDLHFNEEQKQNGVLEVKQTLEDRGILSKLAPIKDLIAAAQAKRVLSRSTFFFDGVVDGKFAPDAVVSPKLLNKEDSAGRGSPSIPIFYHRPGSDDGSYHLENGIKTPLAASSRKMLSKNHSEAITARRCFESLLCTLSRTKESIGRATRLAIDCAKYGIAGEVLRLWLERRTLPEFTIRHHIRELEYGSEASLSISYSRRPPRTERPLNDPVREMEGMLVDEYGRQSEVPQPGGVICRGANLHSSSTMHVMDSASDEDVVYQKDKHYHYDISLSVFFVELLICRISDVGQSDVLFSCANCVSIKETLGDAQKKGDPLYETVPYDSQHNASFQLPQFLNTRILEDDEGSDSDEKGFEAVTPDMNAEIDYEKGMTPISANKHRLVLEDVDGELEMEDVAPSCGLEPSRSSCHVKGVEILSYSNNKCPQNNICSFDPPLPEERPPSPPPLPSSPPPVPLPCSSTIGQAPHYLAGSIPVADNTDFDLSNAGYPISQQTKSLHCSSSLSDPAYSQGYVGQQQQLPQLVSSCTSSGSYGVLTGSQSTVPVVNNSMPIVSMPSTNKVYHLQPPPPVVSNQFSYIQAQPQHRPQALGTQSSYSDRFHLALDIQRGNFFGDGGSSGPVHTDTCDRSAFYPSIHAGTSH